MKYWIIDNKGYDAKITQRGKLITLSNGLISRAIDVEKGTVAITNEEQNYKLFDKTIQLQMINSGKSNDIQLTINGKVIDFYSYFLYDSNEQISPIADIDYTPTNDMTEEICYPPIGKAIKLKYISADLDAYVIYEIFNGLPVICKRLHILNKTNNQIKINQYVLDYLHISEENYSRIYVETNYNGGCMLNNNRRLSASHNGTALSVGFDLGPNAVVDPKQTFIGLRAYMLAHTSTYYEQKMIEVKQMYRKICPWVLDSPLIFHVLSDKENKLKKTIDMVKNANFDMVIQSFGSGVNIESTNEKYKQSHRKIYDYAHSKGLRIGGYTLAIVKNYRPVKGKERNTSDKSKIMRCLATEWSEEYWKNILSFYDSTGADSIEIDGPYHFLECNGGESHLHKGLEDSKYLQWRLSNELLYKEFRKKNVYINTPDWMFLNGTNKCGIGYEEIAFSQHRQAQLICARIYNYKGTFNKIPSMAWSFVPIDTYHGGGANAKFSPLKKNINDYEWTVFQHVMSGVLPCFRGKKLYDCDKTLQVIRKWSTFYKEFKHVLNGTTIHFLPPKINPKNSTRTTGLDAILNVISYGDTRGILAVFNQTDNAISQQIALPLYYANLAKSKYLPTPHPDSGITQVTHPVFGKYPPTFPISEEKEIVKTNAVTATVSPIIISESNISLPATTAIIGKACFAQEGKNQVVVDINQNSDALIDIHLQPMSYTYFIITPYKKID